MTETSNSGTDSGDEPTLDQETHWQQAAQRKYCPENDGGLTTAIVFALAEADGVSPVDLKSPPLYDVVDVAGIENALFGSRANRDPREGTGTIKFRYREYLVEVRSDRWIQIYEPIESGEE